MNTSRPAFEPLVPRQPVESSLTRERKQPTQPTRHISRRLVIIVPLMLIATAAIVVMSVIGLLVAYWYYTKDLPPTVQLDVVQLSQSTKIYDRNGGLLFEIFDPQGGKRTLVKPDQIPLVLKQAVIATEDPTFYSNLGVDPYAILRAIYYDIRYGRIVVGGSTITQQLIKNLSLSTEPTIERKIREAFVALELTRRYPKDQILAAYLNAIYYGNLAYGIQAAAQAYFHKDVSQLTLAEASLLAGLPQAPALYDPCDDVDAALDRQQVVLGLMVKARFIQEPQASAASREMAERLQSAEFAKQCNAQDNVKITLKAPHFVNYVRAQLEKQFGPEVMYKAGLQVTTTLDPQMQAAAEEEAKKQIDALRAKNVTNAAVVMMHPHTGEIYAMVGSVDFFNSDISGQVNIADRPRQPGSAIKPINYVTAFKHGWTPATPIYDLRTNFPDGNGRPPFVPLNYDGREHGLLSARVALASSLNIPAVKTLYSTSSKDQNNFPRPLAMLDTARSLGITTLSDEQGRPRQTYGLALTLGGGDVKLIELARAYSVFANQGAAVERITYSKIVDGKGKVIYDLRGKDKPKVTCAHFDPAAGDEQPDANGFCAKSAPYAYLITNILSDDNARLLGFGPNSVLKVSRPAAVKTGTTDDFRDNWTIGWTPDLLVGVWVGNANNSPMQNVSGVSGAAPIWHNLMERVLKDTPPRDFPVPPGIVQAEICTDSGLLATEWCPPDHRRVEIFVAGHEPTQPDNVWQKIKACSSEGIFQVPPHDIDDLIPYEQIWGWAQHMGWRVPPPEGTPCGTFHPNNDSKHDNKDKGKDDKHKKR